MARKIIKTLGGDRIGTGAKMNVLMGAYGYSTHDISKVRRTSMSFGTIVPFFTWLMTSNSRLRIDLDALCTSNPLLYQLYGSAKFQLDVFTTRVANYNPKMTINLNDQGYNIKDIKFPLMELTTNGLPADLTKVDNAQINPSALLRYFGINQNGQDQVNAVNDVTRQYCAHDLLFYYQCVKEYYANKQEKVGVMIHGGFGGNTITGATILTNTGSDSIVMAPANAPRLIIAAGYVTINYTVPPVLEKILFTITGGTKVTIYDIFEKVEIKATQAIGSIPRGQFIGLNINNWDYAAVTGINVPELVKYDLKAVDRMMMKILANVESANPLIINKDTEMPYGASFRGSGGSKSINTTQEGLCVGTYQADVFNVWLDNATINAQNNKTKVKVDANGEFSIDALNITQKLYNYEQRISATDGTLEDWREVTYGEGAKTRSLKPVYEGGLSKEIVFDMVVSTASTTEDPLASIASRGQFGNKHKGGRVQIDAPEEMLVMILGKITPRLVYNQGVFWTTQLKTLDDLHKPALDKIGYQNLITDGMAGAETRVLPDKSLITYSAGKQPAFQNYRTNFDDALGNMAGTEDYKVFGRTYEFQQVGTTVRIKDLTTYIDPRKFNDVFAIESLDAMNFDIQVGIDATYTLVMSEEVIPNL